MDLKVIIIELLIVLSVCACGAEDKAVTPQETHYPSGDLTYTPSKVQKVLDAQQKAAFGLFYEGSDPATGMAYEGTERGTCITTGGSGFGIMALCVGVERGWITRDAGVDRMRKIVKFLTECERYRGVWSHWYNPDGTYIAFGDQKATGDLVETGHLLQGLLVASEYFNRDDAQENGIRDGIENLFNTIDWKFYTGGTDHLYWLWYSETDKFSLPIVGWNEGLTAYIFALAAPQEHAIEPELYRSGWGTTAYPNRVTNGYKLPLGSQVKGGPLFFTHYSFLGFNPKLMMDDKCWYYEQNLSHTLLNRYYCLYEAPESNMYGPGMWGLTACYGAGTSPSYEARNPLKDDGVIAPTAALSSMPYTPFYSVQVLMELDKIDAVKGRYGFADSYKPSENAADRRHLSIDQGPIVVMIENYRSGLVWNLLMKNKHAQRGLELAGIRKPALKEGFVGVPLDTRTRYSDLLQHPDRKVYEVDFFLDRPCKVNFIVRKENEKEHIKEVEMDAPAGLSTLTFDAEKITRASSYVIAMTTESGETYELKTILH